MAYQINWDKRAYRELKNIEKVTVVRILKSLNKLQKDPFGSGIPLKGKFKNKFRLRVGDFRIIYWVEGQIVWIIAIGHRKEVYRI